VNRNTAEERVSRQVSPTLAALACCLFLQALAAPAFAQGAAPAPRPPALVRPVPNPVVPVAGFRRAVARGTRTTTGVPGPSYWQQHARYTIAVRLDVEAKRLDGTTRIVYLNNSPSPLGYVVIQLLQNYHQDNVVRLVATAPEITGGYAFTRVAAGGQTLQRREGYLREPSYTTNNTGMFIVPPAPVAPHDSVVIETEWSFRIPQRGVGSRMGWNGSDLFYLGYFYPQMAVYDDVVGWQQDPFLGLTEFYAGFGDYDVTLDVPEGWLVRGTGRLLNEREVLPDEIIRRLRLAEAGDTVVHVLTGQDFGPGRATRQGQDGRLRWHFAADTVRDVAYSVTRASLWDAARSDVGDRDGDGRPDYALAEAIYRPGSEVWRQGALYAQRALAFHSRHTGLPYPYPHGTAVEGDGIIGGGMEFPMITLIGGPWQGDAAAAGSALNRTVSHELAHNWMPMIVNSDERRHGWMDEGVTRYNDRRAMENFYPGYDGEGGEGTANPRGRYLATVRTGSEGPLMRWSYLLDNSSQYGTQAYEKPAVLLTALRHMLGAEAFARAYQGYVRTWAFRHPKPWDFFNYFSSSTGQDLGWFWRTWYEETWTLDQAVAVVTPGPRGTEIQIHDLGDAPMPARVTVTLANGDTLQREIPVTTWLGGTRTATVSVPRGREVTRVEVDAEQWFPDVTRKNNVWTREAEALPRSLPLVVRAELTRMRGGVLLRNYRPEGEALGDSARPGVTVSRSVTLQGGAQYAIVAACDEECGDMDLALYAPSDTLVAQDQNPDDTPVLTFTAPATGTYRLDVGMFRCDAGACAWGAQILRR